MKRIIPILICIIMLSLSVVSTNAMAEDLYKVRVKIIDQAGNSIDHSQIRAFVSNGKEVAWGKSRVKQLSGGSDFVFNASDEYFEFSTAKNDTIQYSISCDNAEFACFITDKVIKQDLKKGAILEKTYKLSELKKITLKASFMNRSTGKYEVSIYNPLNTSFEVDNYGSLFEMKADGSKDLYTTTGKYNYEFKYIDKGVCALTYRDNVSALDTRSISIAKENVSLVKYIYKIPRVFEKYIYYIMHVERDNHRAYLTGLFNEASTLDFYMDKRLGTYSQNLVLSKDAENEYNSSIWLSRTNKIPTSLGSTFSPGSIEAYGSDKTKKSMRIQFADTNGNSISFVDMNGERDTIIEIYDKSTGIKLYESTFSRYWDYFNPQLKNGSYIAKVYLTEKILGIDSCSYYDLKVDSATPNIYKFTKLFSLQI